MMSVPIPTCGLQGCLRCLLCSICSSHFYWLATICAGGQATMVFCATQCCCIAVFFVGLYSCICPKPTKKPISSKRSSGVQINIGFFRDSCSKLSEVGDMQIISLCGSVGKRRTTFLQTAPVSLSLQQAKIDFRVWFMVLLCTLMKFICPLVLELQEPSWKNVTTANVRKHTNLGIFADSSADQTDNAFEIRFVVVKSRKNSAKMCCKVCICWYFTIFSVQLCGAAKSLTFQQQQHTFASFLQRFTLNPKSVSGCTAP